jgi:tellurite resistance protein TehA-like permease
MINAVVFALIFVAFGCLRLLFLVLCLPRFLRSVGLFASQQLHRQHRLQLPLQFGVLGLAVMLIAALGFALSLKSIRQKMTTRS